MALGDKMAIVFPRSKNMAESLGESLNSGFQALANMKMQEYSQRQQMKMQQDFQREQQQYQQGIYQKNNFQTLMAMGYPQEKAQQMANTDPALLKEIVKYDMQQKGNAPLAQIIASMYGDNQQNGQQIQPGQEQQPSSTGPNVSAEQLQAIPRHELMQTAQMLGKQKQHEENLAFKKSEALKKDRKSVV